MRLFRHIRSHCINGWFIFWVPAFVGVTVSAWGGSGEQSLMRAMLRSHPNFLEVSQIKRVLEEEADVNETNGFGETALMQAAAMGTDALALVRFLIKSGAKIDLADHEGQTALIQAAAINSSEVVDLLLKFGADPNARDNQGRTALLASAGDRSPSSIHKPEVLRALLNHGADVNARDNSGVTAFMSAAGLGPERAEKLLLSRGARQECRKFVEISYQDVAEAVVWHGEETTRLVLPLALKEAIEKGFPEDRLPEDRDYKRYWWECRGAPFILFGDFDGDGRQDIAAILLPKDRKSGWKLVIFNARGQGFEPHLVREGQWGDDFTAQSCYLKSGELWNAPHCLVLRIDGTKRMLFSCWKGGKYETYFKMLGDRSSGGLREGIF